MRWPDLTVYGVFPSDVFCRSGGWHAIARAITEASPDEQRCAGTPRPHPRVLRASPLTFALKYLLCCVPHRNGGVWLSLTLHGVFPPGVSGEGASRGSRTGSTRGVPLVHEVLARHAPKRDATIGSAMASCEWRWPYLTVHGVFPSDVFCRSGGWHAIARAITEASPDEQRCAGTPRPHPRVLRASPFTSALK